MAATAHGPPSASLGGSAWPPCQCSAVAGAALVLLPGMYTLPQQDRPYGWLTDRLAVGTGWTLLALAALFALLALALFTRARHLATSG